MKKTLHTNKKLVLQKVLRQKKKELKGVLEERMWLEYQESALEQEIEQLKEALKTKG